MLSDAPSTTRVPGAASSLSVQVRTPALTQITNSSIQLTDVQLLTKSILSNQARQRLTLSWQERLLSPTVSFETLKRALTYLSPSSWIQAVQERHLAEFCSYPLCSNPAPKASGGTHRISLSKRKVCRNTEGEGGQGLFCKVECWRRAEWVRTWVLKDRDEGTEGGRWEREMQEEEWEQIELLEDLEGKGELVELLNEKEEPIPSAPSKSRPPPAKPAETRKAASMSGKPATAEEQVAALNESLVIRERDIQTISQPTVRWQDDVPNTLFSSTKAAPTEEEDDDVLGLTSSDVRAILGSEAKLTAQDHNNESDSEEEDVDPKVLAEKMETLRLMDQGLRARDEQRELGLLD